MKEVDCTSKVVKERNIRYIEGVGKFIQFAKKKNSKFEIRCPCKWYDNRRLKSPEVIRDHFLKRDLFRKLLRLIPSL